MTNKCTIKCCGNCMHSALLQYDSNPVLADCLIQPTGDDKFPYERDVASRAKECTMHKLELNNKQIEHRTHRKEDVA